LFGEQGGNPTGWPHTQQPRLLGARSLASHLQETPNALHTGRCPEPGPKSRSLGGCFAHCAYGSSVTKCEEVSKDLGVTAALLTVQMFCGLCVGLSHVCWYCGGAVGVAGVMLINGVYPIRPGKKICSFYVNNGWCAFKAQCRCAGVCCSKHSSNCSCLATFVPSTRLCMTDR
jgi:hypothetical protein